MLYDLPVDDRGFCLFVLRMKARFRHLRKKEAHIRLCHNNENVDSHNYDLIFFNFENFFQNGVSHYYEVRSRYYENFYLFTNYYGGGNGPLIV